MRVETKENVKIGFIVLVFFAAICVGSYIFYK